MKKPRILLSLMTEENDYQMEQAASARRVADTSAVELQILFANNDTITQSTQLLRAIQGDPVLRPDGIIFEPVGGTALPQVARTAINAGMAWGVLNNVPDYLSDFHRSAKVPVFSISTDHEEIGRIQARQFSALLPRGGNVLYIQGPSEHFAAKQRTTGLQAVLAANIKLTNLRGNWTEEGAARSVSSWLKLTAASKLRLDLVGAQNDAMANAARNVIQAIPDPMERDRWMNIPFTGCDGLAKNGQAWVQQGKLAATVIMQPSAGEALRLLLQYLGKSTEVPERNWLPPQSYPSLEKLKPIAGS